MEELWKLIFGKEKEPTPISKTNTTLIPPTNQAKINTQKKKDHVALVAI